MVAIAGNKREFIYEAVRAMYTAAANQPGTPFHFPTGRAACLFVGYRESDLEGLPDAVIESFAGLGCSFTNDLIRTGDRVLDLGCGSGTDTLIAAHLAGNGGRVYALDMTEAMREKLRANVERLDVANVEILAGTAEEIPLPDHAVDVVISNGVLNLVPDKPAAIREIYRVLRPGGRVQIADIALARPISGQARQDPKLWAECIVGAVDEERYRQMFEDAGFAGFAVIGELDYFAGARSEETR